MYARIYSRHRRGGCWRDREEVREPRRTVYDAARLESNAPLLASRPLSSVWLHGANATILPSYVCAEPLKGTTGGEAREKTAGQFDGTHEATVDISPACRHRGNLALRRTGEVTAISR